MDNKEKTKEYIKVMQAYVDGAEIEERWLTMQKPEWLLDPKPLWQWETHDYRIKKTELVNGMWYASFYWSYPRRFVAIDGINYIFADNNKRYKAIINLPFDITEAPEPSL